MKCNAPNCESDAYAQGYCQPHYRRFKKYGNPLLGRTASKEARDYVEALATLPEQEGCLFDWPFSFDQDGYPKLGSDRVCRLILEKKKGPSPVPTHHAAHSCGNGMAGCVAWWHLDWKSLSENNTDKFYHGTSIAKRNRK